MLILGALYQNELFQKLKTTWESQMDRIKIIRIIALAVAIIAAFIEIPYVALAFIVLGLAIGFIGVPEERRLLFMVTAVTLTLVADSLGPIPVIGAYLTTFLGNVSAIINVAALAVILMIFKDRITE
jgi:hypothetical protein